MQFRENERKQLIEVIYNSFKWDTLYCIQFQHLINFVKFILSVANFKHHFTECKVTPGYTTARGGRSTLCPKRPPVSQLCLHVFIVFFDCFLPRCHPVPWVKALFP